MHESFVHIYKEDKCVVVVGVVHRITISVDASLLYMGWMRPRLGHLAGVIPQWRAAGTRKWERMREVYKPAWSCCVILTSMLGASKGAKEDLQGFLAPADFLKLFQMQPLPTKSWQLSYIQNKNPMVQCMGPIFPVLSSESTSQLSCLVRWAFTDSRDSDYSLSLKQGCVPTAESDGVIADSFQLNILHSGRRSTQMWEEILVLLKLVEKFPSNSMLVRFQFELSEITWHNLERRCYSRGHFLLYDMPIAVPFDSWETKGWVGPFSLGKATCPSWPFHQP